MLKTTMLAALAAISACGMAQDRWWNDSNRDAIDANGKTHSDLRQSVCREDYYLSAGDAYAFETMLDRMPGNTEIALVKGLFAAHRQAVLIRDQIIASQFPNNPDVMAMASNDQRIIAEETDGSMRPMRMVMQEDRHRDINYERAYDILTADLNPAQETLLGHWWDDEATERQKDIIVRLLKVDAKRADDPIYPSLYMNVKIN